MIIIPPDSLEEHTLHNLIEAFVLREGTDYGAVEQGLTQKCKQVWRQLQRSELVITYDQDSESVNIIPAQVLQQG